MKITEVKTYAVHPGWRKNLLFVKVETDAGIHGWGEAYSQYDRDRAVIAQLDERDTSLNDRRVLTPQQLRAARAMVGWSREKLAERSGVPAITTKQFENGDTDPRLSTLHKWRRALEAAGVIFIEPDDKDGAGVRVRGSKTKR